MLCILSPAKTLDLAPYTRALPTSSPALKDQADALAALGKSLSASDLQSLMKISAPLAARTQAQFHAFRPQPEPEGTRPAGLIFAGEVYRGLDAKSLSDDDLAYAQARVAILSGLYGVLQPLDAMQPYRLEMGTRLQNPRGRNLYQFWGDRVTERLNALTAGHADRTVVNLASKEYSKVVKASGLAGGMLTLLFKERGAAGKLKTVAVYAKKARGMMARYAITERLEAPAGLKGFAGMGYGYSDAASSDSEWVFVR